MRTAFQQLQNSHRPEKPKPGHLRRISPDDSQDYPTIVMPYELEVPVVHASAAICRIIALAYLLIWAWHEHLRAAELRRESPTSRVVFLIDEVEAHLHPSWQKRILPALFHVMAHMQAGPQRSEVQMIASTHAPLVCVSLEAFFDSSTDAMLDLDLDREQGVKLEAVEFERRGRAENWLVSRHFDLRSSSRRTSG